MLTSPREVVEFKEEGLPQFRIANTSTDSSAPTEVDGEDDEKDASEEQFTRPLDPIHWFGVLVPPSLRQAQKSFNDVVTISIPRILTLSSQMREVEMEIGRTRKTIKRREKTIESDISPSVSLS